MSEFDTTTLSLQHKKVIKEGLLNDYWVMDHIGRAIFCLKKITESHRRLLNLTGKTQEVPQMRLELQISSQTNYLKR